MNENDLKEKFKTWSPDLDPNTCDPGQTFKADVDDSLLLTSTSLPGVSMSGDKTNPGLGSTIENDSRDGAEDETEIFENKASTDSDSDDTAEPGVVYQLGDVLGRGGMGVVYTATQVSLNREVAVKCILPDKAQDQRLRKKFTAEAQVVGLLDHPNIVPVHDLGTLDGDQILLAMKKVGGEEWSTLLHHKSEKPSGEEKKDAAEDDKSLDQSEHLKLLQSVCHAVEYAHSKGFVHLDLKPSNVMVGDFGEVYVMDWGVAAELKHDDDDKRPYRAKPVYDIRGPIGTPQYMSSEQAFGLGRKIGTWTDVYLLGAILHEILIGRPPHLGTKFLQVILAAQKSETPSFDSSVPKELAELCIHALKKETEERIQTVEEFRHRLEQYLKHRESLAISKVSNQLLSHCQTSFNELKVAAEGQKEPSESERNQLYDDFSETVNGFRQAQTLWQENKDAIAGEKTTRLVYAEAALFHNDIGLAEAQTAALERLGAPPGELRSRIQSRKYEMERAARNAQLTRYGLGFAAALLILVMTVAYFLVSDQKALAERERDIAKEEKIKADQARDKETKSRLAAEKARAEAVRARRDAEEQKRKALAAQSKEQLARLESEKQRKKAEYAKGQALLQYGNSLVAQGDALQLAKLDFEASRRYSTAAEIFTTIGQSVLPAEMPLWTLFQRSPPPITSVGASRVSIYSICLSPTGRILALGNGRGELQLWDILKGKKLREWSGHKGTVRSMTFNSDGTMLLTGGVDDFLRCWTLKDQKMKWEFQGPRNEVSDVAMVNPETVIACPGDSTPVLLEVETGKVIRRLKGHQSNVPSVSVSKDGGRCLTGSFDRTLRLWDLKTGEELIAIRQQQVITAVALSPNGLYAACAGNDFGINVWDLNEKRVVARLSGHRADIGRMIYSADGRLLMSASRDGTTRLWDVARQRNIQSCTYSQYSVEGVAWVPNTELFVTAGRDGFWHLWKSFDKTILKPFPFKGRLAHGAAMSHNGRFVAACGPDRYAKSRQVVIQSFLDAPEEAWKGIRFALADSKIKNQVSAMTLWDVETKQMLHQFDNKPGKVMDVAFSPDDRKLVSGGLNIQIWDVEGASLIKSFGEDDLVYKVAFGPEGKKIYSGGMNIRVWDAETGKMLVSHDGRIYTPRSLEFSSDCRYYAASSLKSSNVELREVQTDKLVRVYETGGIVMNRIAFSHDGKWIGAGASDGTISVWNRESGAVKKAWNGTKSMIMSLALSSDGALLVTGSRNAGLHLFEVASGRMLCKIGAAEATNLSLEFIRDELRILSCSDGDTVDIWNLDYLNDLEKRAPQKVADAPEKVRMKSLAHYYKYRGLWVWARVLLDEDKSKPSDESKLTGAQIAWAMGDLKAAKDAFVALKDHEKYGFYARLCLRGFAATLKERAFQRFQVNDFDGAYKDYSAAIELAPKWGELWFWRGSVRAAQKKPKQAVNNFKRAVKLGYITTQLYYRRAMAYLAMRDLRSAKADFDAAIKKNPYRVEPYIGRGTLLGMVRREDLARRDYTRAIQIAPNNPRGYTYRALSYDISGMPEKAEADHNKAILVDPKDEQARLNRGFHLYKRNLYDKAIVDFNVILQRNPRNSMVHALKADCYYSKQNWSAALKSYNAAIFHNPRDSRHFFSRGTVHRVLKQYKEAIADYERYLVSNPDPRRVPDAKEYLRWAKAKVSGKELGSDPLKKGASEQDVKDRFLYAFTRYEEKDYEASDAVYQEIDGFIAKDDKKRRRMHYDWACVKALKKDLDGAFQQLKAAIASGYKNKEHMASDKDLQELRSDPRWKPLLESIKP